LLFISQDNTRLDIQDNTQLTMNNLPTGLQFKYKIKGGNDTYICFVPCGDELRKHIKHGNHVDRRVAEEIFDRTIKEREMGQCHTSVEDFVELRYDELYDNSGKFKNPCYLIEPTIIVIDFERLFK